MCILDFVYGNGDVFEYGIIICSDWDWRSRNSISFYLVGT